MRFNAAVTTLMFAGVLAATPQLAAAAGCLGYNDVKTTHAEAAENGGNTEITLDGSCYNLVSIVYLGQQNGTMVQVPAGNVQNNGSNQIIVTTNGLLAPGDYRVELWYNTFGGGAPTANGSAFLTVAGALAGGGATGYERVAGTTSPDDENAKTATATCPEGKKVVGGGWAITNQSGILYPAITSSQATSDTVWTVTSTSLALPGDNSYSLTAYAVCIVAEADAP